MVKNQTEQIRIDQKLLDVEILQNSVNYWEGEVELVKKLLSKQKAHLALAKKQLRKARRVKVA